MVEEKQPVKLYDTADSAPKAVAAVPKPQVKKVVTPTKKPAPAKKPVAKKPVQKPKDVPVADRLYFLMTGRMPGQKKPVAKKPIAKKK